MADEQLKAILDEHLAPLGPVAIKRMFGGAGLFLDGLMFGLVANGALYLKADEVNRGDFENEGLAPFSYRRKNATATLASYWRAPERLLDEPDELLMWAEKAFGAARRKPRKPRKPKIAKPRAPPKPPGRKA